MDKHIVRHALVWITTIAITLGVSPADPATAHHGQPQAVGGRGTAFIDGQLSPGEWVNAGTVDLAVQIGGGRTTPGRLLVQNDDQNLYLALYVDVRDVPMTVTFSSFVVEFDNDHSGGLRDEGDDVFVADPSGRLFDDYRTYLPPCPTGALCGLLDTQVGGTNDGNVVFARTAHEVVYEVSKPLDSADDAHDFSLHAGDVVGFWLGLSAFTPTEFLETTYPFFVPTPNLMADLRIVGAAPADTTAPTIASSISPAPNANGWNNGPTTIEWIVADPESGIASSSGCGPTVINGETAGTSVTCSATNGVGISAGSTVNVRIDTTAPDVTFIGNAGTYDVDETVLIACVASDALSGLATAGDCGSISRPAYAFPIGASTYERSATDLAGNETTATTTFSVVVTPSGLCDLTTTFVQHEGIGMSLCVKLGAGAYQAFANEVHAQRGKAIATDQADVLLMLASQL